MAKTARRDGPSSRQLGRHLKQVRRQQGLSRAEVARSAGLTRRELGAYERGRVDVPESDLWCLAGSCGVDVSELLPTRDPLQVTSDLSSLAVGDSIRHLRGPAEPDGLLREYLAMIYELRNLPPGSRVPLREPDLMTLADALGGTPEAIEQKLAEVIGASREEAARLRAMILPPLSLPAALQGAGTGDPYTSLGTPGASDGVVDFFSAPRAEDPFAPPPPLTGATLSPSEAYDVLPPDPFAPPPSSPPVAAGPAPADPPAVAPLTDPFVPDAPPSSWGSDRELPDGLVVDHGVSNDAAPATADPFAAPEPFVPPEPFTTPGPLAPPGPFIAPESGIDGGALAPYVAAPDAVDASNGNGHHDLAVPVDAEPGAIEDGPVDADPLDAGPVAIEDGPTDDDPLDGLVSDTPLLAESTLFDGPEIDDVIADLVAGPTGAARPEIVAEPTPPLPEVPAAEHPVAERPVAESIEPDIDATPADDDVAPISWVATEAPRAEAAPTPRFEQVGANWKVGGTSTAAAAADDGALAIRRADARWALADIEAPGDLTIDATVAFTAGTGFGILFRASVDDAERVSGYSFDLDLLAGGGGYLLRQWEDGRQHWRPLAHAPVADPSMLYGRRAVQVAVRGDHLECMVDGETVLSVPGLSRASVALGRTPSRAAAVGVQASATTELTVDAFRIAR